MSRCVVVTGSRGGIGKAISERFLEEGWTVFRVDLNFSKDDPLLADSRVVSISCDITDPDSVVDAVSAINSKSDGMVNSLVNNAGVIVREAARELPYADFVKQVEVSLHGAFLISQALYKCLKGSYNPSIVNIGSVGSTFGLPGRVGYVSAKTGVIGLTRGLASEWGRDGIRVNALMPGYIDSPMFRSGLDEGVLDERKLLERIPIGRFGDATDIANAAFFLASNQASYINGAAIPVDGGIVVDGNFE